GGQRRAQPEVDVDQIQLGVRPPLLPGGGGGGVGGLRHAPPPPRGRGGGGGGGGQRNLPAMQGVYEVMPAGWRYRRVAAVAAAAAAIIGVSALFIVLGIRNQQAADAALLPPIMPTADAPYASCAPAFRIPASFTAADDARAQI